MKKSFYFWIVLVVFLMDQASKAWVLHGVFGGFFWKESVTALIPSMFWKTVTPFFNVAYVWNRGVSFGLLSSQTLMGRVLISLVALVIVGFLFVWLRLTRSVLTGVAVSMMVGGALGNIFDRVRLGAVFDFLDFHVGMQHWPAFNLADSFISIGVVIILFEAMAGKK